MQERQCAARHDSKGAAAIVIYYIQIYHHICVASPEERARLRSVHKSMLWRGRVQFFGSA